MCRSAPDGSMRAATAPQRRGFEGQPWMLTLALAVPAAGLSLVVLQARAPIFGAAAALVAPDAAPLDALLVAFTLLPRLAMALVCGAALGLSAALFQQVLQNRLAEPSTVGVSAGASLAIVVAILWHPDLFAVGHEWVALAGGGLGCLAVFLAARRQRYSPDALIVAGLVVSLYCGSLASLAMLYQPDRLESLFAWQAGSLRQNGWDGVASLSPRLAAAWLLAWFLARPAALLGLGDAVAGATGLNVRRGRAAILAIAVFAGASATSAVGPIGFVGLAAPHLARLSGARTARLQLLWSPLVAAVLLWLADGIAQVVPVRDLPTGVTTALLGTPILLALLARQGGTVPSAPSSVPPPRARHPLVLLAVAGVLLAGVAGGALVVGKGPGGFDLSLPVAGDAILQWRWPRIAAAAAAGTLLGIAGCLLQRLTGNPMASPEVLGVTSGAALGYVLQLMIPALGAPAFGLAGAGFGAAVALGMLLLLGGRAGGGPDRVLLVGVALTSLAGAFITLFLATHHPALRDLLGWLLGSTAGVSGPASLAAIAATLAAILVLPALGRWLAIVPLGPGVAGALGVPASRARMALLAYCAAASGMAALLVGPMSFVGLMAPHIARFMGLTGIAAQVGGAGLIGALLLVAADWFGRTVLFPWEIPAGLAATFLGGPYFLWLMQRRRR